MRKILAFALMAQAVLMSGDALAQPIPALMQPDGVIEKIESEYNLIIVEKHKDQISLNFGYRNLRYTESAIDWSRKDELIVTYTRFMTAALAYGATPVRRIALVGLGGGRTISYLVASLPDASADVAELDPSVIDVARRYFGVQPDSRLRVHPQDGRIYLTTARDKYDLVILDAYRGPFVPFHLTTREFYKLVSAKLNPGGVVVQNVEPSTMFFDSAFVTMKSVFDQVDAFDAGGNVVLVGYSGKRLSDADLARAAGNWQERYKLRYDLRDLVKARVEVPISPSAKALTDDFAPVENLNVIRRHNDKRQ